MSDRARLKRFSFYRRRELGRNRLSGTLPSALGELRHSLTILSVFLNQLEGTIPSQFWQLTNLDYLFVLKFISFWSPAVDCASLITPLPQQIFERESVKWFIARTWSIIRAPLSVSSGGPRSSSLTPWLHRYLYNNSFHDSIPQLRAPFSRAWWVLLLDRPSRRVSLRPQLQPIAIGCRFELLELYKCTNSMSMR